MAKNRRTSKAMGRYVAAEQRGRYTAKTKQDTTKSPRWFGALILELLGFGLVVIVMNYLNVLPGSVSPWYLVLGLAAMFAAFFLATRYK
jgi:FtsH-binding integral membrane protein